MPQAPHWLMCKSIEGYCKTFPSHLCAFAIPDLAMQRCSDPAMKAILEKSILIAFGQIEMICLPEEVRETTDYKEVINFLSNKAIPKAKG